MIIATSPCYSPANGSPTEAGETSMKNVQMAVEGNILTIKVDLSKEFGPSSFGQDHHHCLD